MGLDESQKYSEVVAAYGTDEAKRCSQCSSDDGAEPVDNANREEQIGCLMCGACGAAGRCLLD